VKQQRRSYFASSYGPDLSLLLSLLLALLLALSSDYTPPPSSVWYHREVQPYPYLQPYQTAVGTWTIAVGTIARKEDSLPY
jgi:hypothetical protein